MLKKNLLGLMLALSLVACGGAGVSVSNSDDETDDDGGDDVALATLDQLPRATSPVVDSGDASLVAGSPQLATTGIVLGDMNGNTFDGHSSIAACDAANRFKSFLSEAAMGDMILCYIQKVAAANQDLGVDIYDGNSHFFDLDFADGVPDEEGGPTSVKMRIVRTGEAISAFELFACGDSLDDPHAQSEHLRQTIGADGSFTMSSKGLFGGLDWSGGHEVNVSGTLDADGQFVGAKTITAVYYGNGSWGNSYGEGTVVQSSDTLTFDGYETGNFEDDDDMGGSGSFSNRSSVAAQLIDANPADTTDYDLNLLAMGDGAAHALFSGTWSNGMDNFEWNDEVVEGWNGDTTQVDDPPSADVSGPYVSLVANATPPAIQAQANIVFAGDEVYNCDEAAEGTILVDQAALDSECANLDLGYDWIECWQETAEEN